MPDPVGDESVFLRDLILANVKPYPIVTSSHISIPYTYLTLITFKIIGNSLLALRLTNFILTMFLFLFLIKSFKKIHNGEKLTYFITYLLFFIGSVGYFSMGTNDTLFNLGLIILITEVYLYLMGKGFNFLLVLFVLTISAATRSMILIYLPLIFISLIFLLKHNFSKRIWLIIIFPIFCILAMNVNNLKNGFGLSYDNKNPPINYKNLNWTQRQYLSQMQVNKGKIPNKTHVSWEFVDAYLKTNGLNSLPSTLSESLYFDIKLTIKEFIKDFLDILFYSMRQLGLAIFFLMYQVFLVLKKKQRLLYDENLYTMLISLLCIMIFSFIIISFVELRWLCVPFLLSIFYFVDKAKTTFLFYNNVLLLFLMVFSMFKNYILHV